jgi:hypothetical protein
LPIVKLPRKRLISMDRKNILVDVPDRELRKKKNVNMAVIRKAKGIWKKKSDGIDYQKKIRSEWD